MSAFMHAESRRLYSWWWDSHISPKNSKWLQENLAAMDLKVKAMIKLIEEDAYSFARRAEMYYKKRPELMKFVEDFYRAYRALAEIYDHATGALRHAHRTIAEVFPNHIPLALPDESPSIPPGSEIGPCTPEIPSPLGSLFDPDDLQKDASVGFHARNRNVAYAEENESFSTKKGLKQLNEMFAPWEVTTRVKLLEGKVRKGLKFLEEDDGVSQSKVHESKILSEQEVREKENDKNEIKRLQEDVSQLSIENQILRTQIESESMNLDSSRSEVQNLRDAITKLQSEKEAVFLRDQLSYVRISSMETEILNAEYEFGKLHEEIMMGIVKFSSAEEQCFSLEKTNQSLILELEQNKKLLKELRALLVENQDLLEQAVEEKDNTKNEIKRFHEQLSLVSNENQSIKFHLLSETKHLQLSRAEVQSMRDTTSKLESEKEAAILMNQLSQQSISSLESLEILIKELQFGCAELKEGCRKLEDEKLLLSNKLQDMETISERNTVLERTLADATEKIGVLEDYCESLITKDSTYVVEKAALFSQMKVISENMENLSEKNTLLENSLVDANTEVEVLRLKLREFEEYSQFLSEQNLDLLLQKDALISQVEERMNSSLKVELESFCRLFSDFSNDFSNLREEKSALEEENNVLLGEAVALEHLYLFFRSSNAENLQSLQVFNDAICSPLAVKNDHERQIRESEEKLIVAENESKRLKEESLILLEGFRSRTTILEIDLTAKHFCEELILQVEIGDNLLKKKNMELLKAYHKLQCTQVEVTELCTKLNAATTEVDEAKMMRYQFEKKVADLLEGHVYKDVEIITTHEENRMLSVELNRMSRKFELFRKREQYLSSELQMKVCELDRCEGEITNLLINIHVYAVNGAVIEDKMYEWGVAYEGLEICSLVQREILIEGITRRNAHALKLQKKLVDLEKENRKLKADWNSCLPLFVSLVNGIANVENQAHQLANLHDDQEKSNETREGDLSTIAGALEMQNLVSELEEIEKLMLHTNDQLKQERLLYASNLESARREIEELKLEISDKQVKQGNKNSIGKDGQLMKDIEHDRVSNSITLSRIQSAESEDQMLKIWETAERDYSGSVSNSHGIEGVQDFKGEQQSSEIVAEKEVGVDKLEISKEMKQSQEVWNRRVIERLSTGAEKLSVLITTAQTLRAKVERPGKRERRKCSELNAMQTKLKQAVEGILSLVDADGKLMKKLEEHSKLSHGEMMGWLDRREVWEQVLIIMDQIEKLELELQEMHYFFVKLDEEDENIRTQEGDRSPRVLLRDYIRGWRAGQGRKRGRFCGCLRPKTQE